MLQFLFIQVKKRKNRTKSVQLKVSWDNGTQSGKKEQFRFKRDVGRILDQWKTRKEQF